MGPGPVFRYSLTSANDFPDRDPADFKLEGLIWAAPGPAQSSSAQSGDSQPSTSGAQASSPCEHVESDQSALIPNGLSQTRPEDPASSDSDPPIACSNGSKSDQKSRDIQKSPAATQEGSSTDGHGSTSRHENAELAGPATAFSKDKSSSNEHHSNPAANPITEAPVKLPGRHRKLSLEGPAAAASPELRATPSTPPFKASSQNQTACSTLPSIPNAPAEASRQQQVGPTANGSQGGSVTWVVLDEQKGVRFAHRHQRLEFCVEAPRACRCIQLGNTVLLHCKSCSWTFNCQWR